MPWAMVKAMVKAMAYDGHGLCWLNLKFEISLGHHRRPWPRPWLSQRYYCLKKFIMQVMYCDMNSCSSNSKIFGTSKLASAPHC